MPKPDPEVDMKLSLIVSVIVVLLVVGGFAYLAIADVPVEQKTVSKVISHERFTN